MVVPPLGPSHVCRTCHVDIPGYLGVCVELLFERTAGRRRKLRNLHLRRASTSLHFNLWYRCMLIWTLMWLIVKWFLGRPLNPTVPGFPSFDIKTFNEVRPGIIGWPLLNFSCACEQYLRTGHVSAGLWLVLAFELYYSIDSLWFEVSVLIITLITIKRSLGSPLFSTLTDGLVCYSEPNGYHHRRFRLHARIR